MELFTSESFPNSNSPNDYYDEATDQSFTKVVISTTSYQSRSVPRYVVPVLGLPGPQPIFYVIHISAIVALIISLVSSGGVLVYMLRRKSNGQGVAMGPQGPSKQRSSFWQRPIGERLVVYLSVCDLLFSLSHLVDHIYLVSRHAFAPPFLCQLLAFSLQEFTLAQAIVVTYTALSAAVMVVCEQKLSLGKYDWRLLTAALGVPFVLVSIAAGFSYLGPSGPWCAIDMGETFGPMLANSISIAIMATFFVNMAAYLLVWLKIKQVSKSMASLDERAASHSQRYQRSVRIMMLFVAVYIGQWWAYVIYALWTFFGVPHLAMTILVVSFTNLGGVFNFLAYTLVRRVGREPKASNAKAGQGVTEGPGSSTRDLALSTTQSSSAG